MRQPHQADLIQLTIRDLRAKVEQRERDIDSLRKQLKQAEERAKSDVDIIKKLREQLGIVNGIRE